MFQEQKKKIRLAFRKIFKNNITGAIFVGLVLATMMIVLIYTTSSLLEIFGATSHDYSLIEHLRGPPPSKEQNNMGGLFNFGGIGDFGHSWEWFVYAFKIYLLVPVIGIMYPGLAFFAIPTVALALATAKIWHSKKKIDIVFVVLSFYIGIAIFTAFWIASKFFAGAIPFFFLAPITNLTLPLAALLFFRVVKKNKQTLAEEQKAEQIIKTAKLKKE